MTNNLTDIRSK